MINSFKDKYLKYKLKYNNLKFQIAGNKNRISGDEHYDTNPCMAAEFYQKAVDENDLDAHYKLGKMYENGIGVSFDIDRALNLYKIAGLKGHFESIDSFRKINFNNFLNKLFTVNELNDKNKLYLFIGTYPYVFKHNDLKVGESIKMIQFSIEYNIIIRDIFIEHQKKLNRDRIKRKENCIEKFEYIKDEPLSQVEIELSNRIYYLIDNNYTKSYMVDLKDFLTTSNSTLIDIYKDITPFHLPIKFDEGNNYLKIHFTRLNVVLYIIKMFVPSQYHIQNIRTPVRDNSSDKMAYSKKCELVNTWNGIYCNILNFLNKPNNKFFLLNDALYFFNGNSIAENRYFEFFCEFGYILHKLYQKNKAKQVFVVLPNTRSNEFFNTPHILPKFTNLHDIYKHNFGIS